MATRPINISLLGDKLLQRKLKRLDVAVQKRIVKYALTRAGRIVLNTVRETAPVGDPENPNLRERRVGVGLLQAYMTQRSVRARNKKGFFGVFIRPGTREQLGITADDPFFYPAALIYGHGRVAPNPFLYDALETNKDICKAEIASQIGAGIAREAGKV